MGHKCDDSCVCPEDGLPLIYAPRVDQHACQDPQCKYAHGIYTEWMGLKVAL